MTTSLLALLAALMASPGSAAAPPTAEAKVRLYRCVSATGAVSLQDEPCAQGRQQVLDMQRPQDPPARTTTVAAPAPAAAQEPVRVTRIVTVQPPRPMYECQGPEGERYLSDDAHGRPRWVPVWVPAHVPGAGHGRPHPPRARPDRPADRPDSLRTAPGPAAMVSAGSVLTYDSCHALPQREVCDRLNDQRWELIRRYNSALQSEREALAREQRGIDARIEQDCRR